MRLVSNRFRNAVLDVLDSEKQLLATGTICAAGTLGQLIPPSIVLIVFADVMGVSVADLFAAAFIPGLPLVALYTGYILLLGVFRPNMVPPPPRSDMGSGAREILVHVFKSILPASALILGVPGSIFFGDRHVAARPFLAKVRPNRRRPRRADGPVRHWQAAALIFVLPRKNYY